MNKEIEYNPTDLNIKDWSEGNEYLENLLISCRNNNLPSMFCCAGHDSEKPAYIVFKMNKETIKKIYSIINILRNKKNISLSFSRNPLCANSRFAVYMYDEIEKNTIMESMANAVCKDEELEHLPQNYQFLLQIVEVLEYNKFNFDLTYSNFEEKKIYFTNLLIEDTDYPFKENLEKLGFNLEQNGLFSKYSIKHIPDKEEQKVLERLLNGMKGICTEFNKDYRINKNDEYDEKNLFKRFISRNGELRNLSTTSIIDKNDKVIDQTSERE